VITNVADNLIDDDESLKPIYNKYSLTGYDSETAAEAYGVPGSISSRK